MWIGKSVALVLIVFGLWGCSNANLQPPSKEISTPEAEGKVEPPPTKTIVRTAASRKDDVFSARGGATLPSVGLGGSQKEAKGAAEVVRVFYATDRKQEPGSDGGFTTGRGDVTTYGFCEVSIPATHEIGRLERPSIWRLEFSEDESRHVVVKLKNIYGTNKVYFQELVADHSRATAGRAILYVHGYNTGFDDAAMRAAQLKKDLDFAGPVVFFSWPSNIALLGYSYDQANMEWSIPDLSNVVDGLVQNSDIKEVIIIAHSMGARSLTAALGRVNAKPSQLKKISHVLLAAPDIDRDVFVRDIQPAMRSRAARLTLYASSHDRALWASERFHGVARLGSASPALFVRAGVDTIDASKADTGFIGHSYYAETGSVVADIDSLINKKLPPPQRKTLQAMNGGSGQYWVMK